MCPWRIGFMTLALVANPCLSAQEKKEPLPKESATYKVGYQDLQLKCNFLGVLEPKESWDIKCEVQPGSSGKLTIKSVVDNGSMVKKGDLIVEIDDAYLQEQAQQKQIDVLKAKADLVTAEQTLPANKAAVDFARLQLKNAVMEVKKNLEKAQLDLKEFDESQKEASRQDAKNKLADAEADVELWRESVATAEKDFKNGKTTETLIKAKRLKLKAALSRVEKAKAELDSLEKMLPEYRKGLVSLVESTQRRVELTQTTQTNSLKQAEFDVKRGEANLESCLAILKLQEGLYQDVLNQVKKCKIQAPNSGQVIYAVSGASSPSLGTGQTVLTGQKLLSIPDLSGLTVSLRINEAFIGYLHAGLQARVEIPGFKPFQARVKKVGDVIPSRSGAKQDVKEYQVTLQIEDSPTEDANRKLLGQRVVCTIFTDLRANHVLAVPIAAVLGSGEKGTMPRCLVVTPRGPEEREVELGFHDGQMIEIKSGLKEGDEVIVKGS